MTPATIFLIGLVFFLYTGIGLVIKVGSGLHEGD
jgi:hypothetical protein